jgi:hypothetical protein
MLTDHAPISAGSESHNGTADAIDEHLHADNNKYKPYESCDDFYAINKQWRIL